MKKLGFTFILILGYIISNAQYFKTEDFELQKGSDVVEQEERSFHFPPGEYTKQQEDSLRALFSEENFKPKKATPTAKEPNTGFLYQTPEYRSFLVARKEEV